MITKNPKRILVADDSVFFRTKLSDILVEAGHIADVVRNGSEVISRVQADSKAIDLLILDLQMPDIDGFGVLKWIADNGFKGAFPILAVSGVYDVSEVMEKMHGMGASGLMTKGFTPEQIVFRVNRLLFQDKSSTRGREGGGRVPVSIPVDFTVGEATHTGFILNISETGAFIHTKDDLLTGSLVHMRFSLPDSERVLDVKGMIRWTTAETAGKTLFGGSGIMFTSITDEEVALIRALVERETKRLGLDHD